MALEPWCFHPHQIASLTDWQIDNLYRKPQSERIKALAADGPGAPGQPGAAIDTSEDAAAGIKATIATGATPSRGQMVALFTMMGVPRGTADQMYTEQLAKWELMKAAKKG